MRSEQPYEQAKRLGKQSHYPRVKLALEKVDVLDTDLLGRIFESLGKNPGKAKGDFGMLR